MDTDSKIQTIRFWGIIFGFKKNYFVAEADADPPDDEEEDPEAEKVLDNCESMRLVVDYLLVLLV